MKYVFIKKDAFRAELKNPERVAHIWIDKERGAGPEQNIRIQASQK